MVHWMVSCDVINSVGHVTRIFFRSNCDSSVSNELRKHYSKPYFLGDTMETSKTDWIFMGSPGYGAHLHVSSEKSWSLSLTSFFF